MEINKLVNEAIEVAKKYNLKFIEMDRTENIISIKLLIDNEFFVQIYGNSKKDKINLTLVFKNRRLYGYDSSGDKYHCHPFDNPDDHIFVDTKKSLREFIQESMIYLEKKNLF
ncbi:MAG: hypothetical protein HY934_10945 [Candidatus Firestonebacteria bacterium]|nr:hypothetical protein [Candidatus Firestonebacteria bacterium]